MHQYVVWLWSKNSGGYDNQFYTIVTAHDKYEAEMIVLNDKRYPEAHVTRVEKYNPGK